MEHIRHARTEDASRIAELFVTNYRVNFYPFFNNDEFYFSELNVMDTAAEYAEGSEALAETFVYDDGIIKGFIRIKGALIDKLFVEPQFQSAGIGAALLKYAVEKMGAEYLWALEYNKRGIAFYEKHGFTPCGEKMIEDDVVPLIKLSRTEGVRLEAVAPDSPYKNALEAINEEAFPECERVSLDGLFATGKDGNLEIVGIFAGKTPVGFFVVRKFGRLRYLAYFAVDSARRGCGVGSTALRMLMKRYEGCQLVTEFEAPDESSENNEIRLRRRGFYLRSGFCETGWYSFYDDTEFELVCSEPPLDKAEFDRFVEYLHTIVSDHILHPYRKEKYIMIRKIDNKKEKQTIAREVLEALREWFEVDESREGYIRDCADWLFLADVDGDKRNGFLCLKETGRDTAEVAVMGVKKECHRSGIGRQLMEAAKKAAKQEGYSFLQVKTVKMGIYEDYDRTNLFYIACGFREFEVFPLYWDEANPCQIYVMAL